MGTILISIVERETDRQTVREREKRQTDRDVERERMNETKIIIKYTDITKYSSLFPKFRRRRFSQTSNSTPQTQVESIQKI